MNKMAMGIVTVLALTMSFQAMADKTAKKAAAAPAAAKAAELDTTKSTVKWLGKKVTGQHDGTIAVKGGAIEVDKNTVKGGTIEIDMTSIKVLDIKETEYNKKLNDHLNSDDFFSVAKHPVSTLKIKEAKELKGNKDATHEIKADLTIKGITHPVTFPAKVDVKDGKASAKGKITVDRTLFEIKYGSGKFFQNLGDKMINDTFELDFDVTTK
jgi:polyisoprenoid-binding protein YceI